MVQRWLYYGCATVVVLWSVILWHSYTAERSSEGMINIDSIDLLLMLFICLIGIALYSVSRSLEQSTHRPQDCYLFNGRLQTLLEDLAFQQGL